MQTANQAVQKWVGEMKALARPDRVVWLDGSEAEYQKLLSEAVRQGQLIPLNPEKHPNCYLHRSHPSDVARTEHCTYICTPGREEAGPTNNWMAPEEALAKLTKLFDGVMRGRTMYVIPYLLGPEGSPFSKVGFELTDSIYVAVNMRIMTRMGRIALAHLGDSSNCIKGLHSVGSLDSENRIICHFPQDQSIYSINSGYGGNALLSKKCGALRIASWMGRNEGWLAEHMLVMGIEDPSGNVSYIAAALPSACGKTNLAMLQPHGKFSNYKIWCVGDDIAWLRPGKDGRLWAINPEAGFFGVAPGTNDKSNPRMMETISKNTLFTNVALAGDKTLWWEGLNLPSDTTGMVDWQGEPWQPGCGRKAAHPNSRFTAPLKQCPIYSPEWENPRGVPLSAIIFGCRRSKLIPLVYESFSWQHGVYLGATLTSETTAAAVGTVGIVRRDPMAMLPFVGYNMADYFKHWLAIGKKLTSAPKIFRVNWFRTNEQGEFIWPGFGENMRVLKWIAERCRGTGQAVKTPLGYFPETDSLDFEGLSLSPPDLETLFEIDREGWHETVAKQTEFFSKFGDRIPPELVEEQHGLIQRLQSLEKSAVR